MRVGMRYEPGRVGRPPANPPGGNMFKTTTRALAGLVAAAGIVAAVAACDPIDEAATASNTNTVVAAADTSVDDNLTAGQRNAVDKAQDYLEYSAFSRSGLIKQLAFEGFSDADATFAVDSLDTDWNAQAVKKAAEYMDYSSFSQQGLVDQLVFEGFTQAEAEHGAASQF
ncbi:lipoprotein [Gordonia phage Kwekel]|uniref:Lipoprotein n=1 Tax=Gordonia phage Kwekel TaxID=3077820 RepID=A0AA96R2D5_9CAUD|nr:lipoprotein [Gordonia phage Kwekel]